VSEANANAPGTMNVNAGNACSARVGDGFSAADGRGRGTAIFLGKILPFREIGFCTAMYRNSFHLSGDPFFG
jgi:hypothetical protein